MSQKLDILLFGASGFTGRRTISYLATYAEIENLTWGVADGSELKLKKVLQELNKPEVPIVVANVQDTKAVEQMADSCRLIINCCGPFRFFGEEVIKACLKKGTHLIDICEEIEFMEEMQLKYRKEAEEKNIYIINACGFNSLPTDLGVSFLEKTFNGTLHSVVGYESIWQKRPVSGSIYNYASWEGLIHGLNNSKKILKTRRELWSKEPVFQNKLKTKCLPHKFSNGYALLSCGPNRSVVNRSQRFSFEIDNKQPIQFENYLYKKSLIDFILTLIIGLFIGFLSRCSCGKELLLKFPEFFTFGKVSGKEPSDHKVEACQFAITLIGEGTVNGTTKSIKAKISGMNPTYGSTCIIAVLAGVTLLREINQLPQKGGFYTPGYAFGGTNLVQTLTNNGILFKVLD